MNGSEPGRPERTPWWFHLLVGFLGLSASLTYVRAGLMEQSGDARTWVIAAVWATFGGLWIVFALLMRRRND